MKRRLPWVAVFAASFVLILAPAAHAYLDPGSGSFVFQVLIGGLLGGAVALKTFGGRIWGFVSRRNRREGAGGRTSDKVG